MLSAGFDIGLENGFVNFSVERNEGDGREVETDGNAQERDSTPPPSLTQQIFSLKETMEAKMTNMIIDLRGRGNLPFNATIDVKNNFKDLFHIIVNKTLTLTNEVISTLLVPDTTYPMCTISCRNKSCF